MSESHPSLYASHKKIYPKYQHGRWRTIKWFLLWLSLGIYYLGPFLRWDRGPNAPDQAILWDLPARKFYLFDLIIWPQEIYLLTFLLIISALALFFVTVLAGRVFCGYFCFQTVWTDLFIWVEKIVEGDRTRRMNLDQAPWSAAKLWKKSLKHLLWILISVATGGAFVFYFADAPTLWGQFLSLDAPNAAWITVGLLTVTTYTMAGFAREQVCIYMCPYARFQGAMFDQDTLIVAYNEERGEPRESSRRVRESASKVGHCIDCGECVRVCPTGIDIRDGQQYQCITCAACIDACNEVMDKAKLPRGLVSYTSLHSLRGEPVRWLRPAVIIYGGLMLAAVGALVYTLNHRSLVELNVIRNRTPVYIQQSDGSIQNNYTVRVLNMSDRVHHYVLTLKGLKDARLSVAAVKEADAAGQPILTVGPGDVIPYTLYVTQPYASLEGGAAPVEFTLVSQDPEGGEDHYESVFLRP
ncbi:MAG: cytochrome c oxidase accessory protein CcoG [Magnetococcus sp. WYHC-3]